MAHLAIFRLGQYQCTAPLASKQQSVPYFLRYDMKISGTSCNFSLGAVQKYGTTLIKTANCTIFLLLILKSQCDEMEDYYESVESAVGI